MLRVRVRSRRAAALGIACLLAVLALAPTAFASSPASDQYQFSPAGSGGKPTAGGKVGDSGGSSALPVLLAGAAAVGGGAVAIAYVRHRRRTGREAT